MEEKVYLRHTGFPGGQRSILAKDLKEKSSRDMVEKAVKGMLPKNRLGRAIVKNLFVYGGTEHPHAAQQPQTVEI